MAYSKHTWTASEAITAEKMNAMETGIYNADNTATNAATAASNAASAASTADAKAVAASSTASNALSTANDALQATTDGRNAWNELTPVLVFDSQGNITNNGHLSNKINKIATNEANIARLSDAIADAYGVVDQTSLMMAISFLRGLIRSNAEDITNIKNAKGEYETLAMRLQAEDQDIDALKTAISNALKSLVWKPGNLEQLEFASLDARFEHNEGKIKTLESEVNDALTSHALATNGVDKTYSHLDDRLEAIEEELTSQNSMSSRLDTIEGNVSGLSDNKINKTDIANNLTTETAGKVLDATQGKILKDSIDALDSTIGASDSAGLRKRIADLETEVTAGHDTYADLDARFDAVETTANNAAVASTVNSALDGINTKINAIATELEMLDNGAIVDTNTRIDTLASSLATAEGNITNLSTNKADVSYVNTQLSTKANASDVETALAGKASTTSVETLNTTVNNLADRDTIVVDKPNSGSNYGNDGKPNTATITAAITTFKPDADYLIADDEGKYFYWRYINNSWELISAAGNGGGGTGTSSAVIAATLPAISAADANMDYYIGDSIIGYTHYRYIPSQNENEDGVYITILPKNLINSVGVNTINVTTIDALGETPATVQQMSGGLTAYNLAHESNLLANFTALRYARIKRTYDTDGQTLKKQELIFTDTNGNELAPIEITGGGGSSAAYTIRLLGGTTFSIPSSQKDIVTISPRPIVNFGTQLAEGIEITATVQYKLSTSSNWENASINIPTITNGTAFNLNVASLLGITGTTTDIRVSISTQPDGSEGDTYTQSTIYHISRVDMSITALNYNPAAIRTGASFQFRYTCAGVDLQKTVYFKIDGTTVAEENIGTSHNDVLTQVISLTDITTGMHTLQVYFMSNGISSNVINTYLICNKDANRVAPIVGLSFDSTEINQGDELTVNYTAYTPGDGVEYTDKVIIEAYRMKNDVKEVIDTFELLNVRNSTVETQTITNYPENENNANYTLYVKITAINNDDETLSDTKTASIIIKPFVSNYTLAYAGTDNLVYSYNAYGFTNNSADKENYTYTYTAHDQNNTAIAFTSDFNNFNWSTDGYCGRSVTSTNETGETVTTLVHDALTISGGATLDINVPILSSTVNGISIESDPDGYDDPTQNGRTIEIDYLVRSATDLNDVIINCIGDNNAGFQVTPQNCFLVKSNPDLSRAVVKDDTGAILNEDAIAAAYLNTGIRTHLVFVIEPWAAAKAYDQKYHQSVNIYINGEFANACPYNRDNSTGNIVDSFATNATISIGKPSCIIDLFSVKLYNRGLTHTEVLQNYKMAPAIRADKIGRFEDNDVIRNGVVDYELAKKKFNCLLLVGPNPEWRTNEGRRYNAMPTISPYKGSPSPIGRKDSAGEVVGKTESGLIFTMPDSSKQDGYKTEFSLLDKMATADDTGYVSSNNVQGTSSQKYPIHNLKIYLAKGKAGTEVYNSDDPETRQLLGYTKSEKVKYKIPEIGVKGKESTLCWKADYMSTDHANTFNANIADTLFTDPMSPDWPENWRDKLQLTVHGIRCLLFQQMGDNPPEFVADGCLNNDKGNSKSYGLEYPRPDNVEDVDPNAEYDVSGTADTVAQKWEFTNNSDDLGFFKYDSLFLPMGNDQHYRALDAFESCWPDQGDLEDAQDEYKKEHDNVEDPTLNPNYNHLQILSSWIAQRANYWNANATPDGQTYTYNGVDYDNVRDYKKAIFKAEFTKHFILDHVLVYYLFSEYVALCDNRVKNMFMRSDTVRKEVIKLTNGTTLFEGNNNPNASFFKEFVQIDTGVVDAETGNPVYAYNMKNVDQIDWSDEEGHSTFAKWAPVLYDLDSCFGVENVGLLKIPYNAGWQYQQNDQYLFNGHDSVFWLMFEDSFQNEIAAKALTLYNRQRGLNYSTFYQEQVVGNQNQIAPAMTNQDMLLKFDTPWATGFMNYANDPPTYETPEYKYLQRGSRATQKASFIAKRSMLLSSKYQSNSFKNDRISMRYGADVPAASAVIKLAANQNFYPAVSFGDNKGWTQAVRLDDGTPVINGLVNAGDVCRISADSAAGGQDTLFIAGASVLTDVGDLSVFKAYEINISSAKNLKKIAFGSHAVGYTNAVTSSIGGLSSCALLEEINIENCTNFSSLDLSANGLIKKVYTQGSGVTSVSLPTGGVLNTLELGANTQNITLLNQTYLQNFVYENSATNHYSSLSKLWIENTPNVPVVEIINSALGHLTDGVRIIGLDVNLGTDPTFLQTITSELAKGKFITSQGTKPSGTTAPPTITGRVTITTIRQSLYDKLGEMYPNLTINVTSEITPEYTITYYDYDGETVLFTDHKTSSERYIDPVKDINSITGTYYIPIPTRPEDQENYYYFGQYTSGAAEYNASTYRRFTGWLKISTTGESSYLTNSYVDGNTEVKASYRTTVLRTYTAKWYAETTDKNPIYTLTADYGTRIGDYLWPDDPNFMINGVKSQMIRAKSMNSGSYYRVFTGWDRPVSVLTEDVNIYGQWKNSTITEDTNSIDLDTLSGADLYALANISQTARTRLLPSHLDLETITVPLGYDFDYQYGVNANTLINDTEAIFTGDETETIIYNGANNRPLITPFQHILNATTGEYEPQSFTLAIDYKFLLNADLRPGTEEYVLASCYKETNNTKQGFKVVVKNTDSNIKPVVVTWGTGNTNDTYVVVDYIEVVNDSSLSTVQFSHGYRNIIVLTYAKENPNQLNVYYTVPNEIMPSLYGTTSTVATLTYTTGSFDAPLMLGGNYDYTGNSLDIEISNNRAPAAGVVYWAKYWDADLGGFNCNKLAAWPHEKLHFYMSGYDSATTESSKLLLNGTKLSFTAAETLGDRRFNASSITYTEDYAGWSSSTLATFYNNRIYAAFPAEYQSVMLFASIDSNTNYVSNLNIRTVITGNYYLFPPAQREVTQIGTDSNLSASLKREANSPWPWLSTTTLGNTGMIYEISSTIGTALERKTSASNIYPFLYRFSNYYLNPNTKIFNTGNTNPYNSNRAWTVTNTGTTVKLAPGDIWIKNDAVYVYVSQEDLEKGIIIDVAESEGGWKLAETWQLRTYTESQDQNPINSWRYFNQINPIGVLVDGGQSSTNNYGQYKGLVFEFAV